MNLAQDDGSRHSRRIDSIIREPEAISPRSQPESGGATLATMPALSNVPRLHANYFVPVVPVVSVPPPRRVSRRSWRPVRRVSRRSWRPARRSPRRSIPLVWASASDTVSTVAGTAKLNAAVIPRRENAVRREISSDLVSSVIFELLSRLSPFLIFRALTIICLGEGLCKLDLSPISPSNKLANVRFWHLADMPYSVDLDQRRTRIIRGLNSHQIFRGF